MKKSHKITIPTALMLILLAVVATFNITFFAATEYYNSQLDQLNQLESRYSKLKSVADIVQKYFVADYDEADAIEGALAGYIDGLGDQWSAYYNKEQTARLAEDDANVYVGIGVTFSTDPASLYTITAVTAGGPAAQAGLLAGDVIRAADGVDVDTLVSSEDLIALVKGEKGTDVVITVDREGSELTFTVTRDEIHTEKVTARMLPGSIGYLALEDFSSGVADSCLTKLNSLKDQGAVGFIFDVRNNPGGYLNEMHKILDALLPEGIVITTVDKQGNETPYLSDADCLGMPLVVLTNEYSISAAEFFAAALQEYEAATVVGAPTSGKGYSQQTFMLSDGSSVHISTTRYYTPKGNSLADTGMTPDILVETDTDQLRQLLSGDLADADDTQLQAGITALNALVSAAANTDSTPAE